MYIKYVFLVLMFFSFIIVRFRKVLCENIDVADGDGGDGVDGSSDGKGDGEGDGDGGADGSGDGDGGEGNY